MVGDGSGTAVDALSAAVSVEPGRGDLWGELATALVAAGRAPEAWDAAVRAVELAPRSAASHRAIGTVAEALGDSAQAESAYRHASLLDPAAPERDAVSGGRHASDRATALAAWMVSQIATPDPVSANGSRHAAPEDPPARHGVPDPLTNGRPQTERLLATQPSTGGRRRAPEVEPAEPAAAEWLPATQPSTGGRRHPPEADPAEPSRNGSGPGAEAARDGGAATAVRAAAGRAAPWQEESAGEVQRATAVGLPGWLGRVGPTPGPDEWARAVPAGANGVADPVAWRRGLIAVVRIEWLVGVVCFLGLAYARTAPYTAGLLAGALVVAGAYGRLRWKSTTARRPPEQDRVPTYAAVAAVATAVVIIPAALAGALTLARVAAVAAVTSATVAAVLLARPVGKDIWP